MDLINEVKNYINITQQEDFMSSYYKDIKSYDIFLSIREKSDYREWFKVFIEQSKECSISKMTFLFSLAQLDYEDINDFEKEFVIKELNNEDTDIVYYALVTVENWDNSDLNKTVKNISFKNNYLNFIANNL